MKTLKNFFIHSQYLLLSACVLVSYSDQLHAHAEHDKARFVATEGQDNNRCDNVLRPCKTIAYAVSQASKGDRILVASGNYHISSATELFYLQSLLVPVLGGYNRFDHFQSQSPDTNPTVLTGIPVDMAAELRKQGFAVIADAKASENKQLNQKLASHQLTNQAQTAATCTNGSASGFACNNIDLLAHMPRSSFSSNPSSANDIWGHVDLNTGNEYAIIGLRDGVAVVNVSEPSTPVEVGTISGLETTWRDIKVYQYYDANIAVWRAYAYVTTDGKADQVMIIDLSHLPNSITLAERNNSINTAHNVYISNVDYSYNVALAGLTPSLQLVGADKHGGAFHNYSLANPATISAVANSSIGSGYTHDGASLVVDDSRKNTDCQRQTDCIVFLDFNEKEIKLWDISATNQVSLLGTGEYTDIPKSAQYVHSGWASEDKQYVFLHDEFDERRASLNSTVRVFDISDLNNPQHVGQWTGPTRAVDHNGFVRGNRYYLSNYERGLTVLDISNRTAPTEVGFFDTYPASNNDSYNGAWGVYPFLPSGNILVSDINGGLYILKDNTHNSAQGQLSFTNKSITTDNNQTIQLDVSRTKAANNTGAVTVDYDIVPGSASHNQDYLAQTGTLSWAANDTSNKTINIEITNDGDASELTENFLVRLYNPSNGANITAPTYALVTINGKTNAGVLSFTQAVLTAAENNTNITLNVSRVGGSAGELKVDYSLVANTASIPDDVANTSGQLVWADGDTSNKTIVLTLVDDNLEENNEQFTVKLTSVDNSLLGDNKELVVTISDNDRNTAPVLNDLPAREVNTSQTVTITAQASDAEDDPISYLWQQTSGPSVSLNNANNAEASFVAPNSAATLGFEVTATDNKNASSKKALTITVVAPPVTPTPTPPTNNDSGGGSMFWLIALLMLTRLGLLAHVAQPKQN